MDSDKCRMEALDTFIVDTAAFFKYKSEENKTVYGSTQNCWWAPHLLIIFVELRLKYDPALNIYSHFQLLALWQL